MLDSPTGWVQASNELAEEQGRVLVQVMWNAFNFAPSNIFSAFVLIRYYGF